MQWDFFITLTLTALPGIHGKNFPM